MRCMGEKCKLKGLFDELLGEVESCTAHNCPDRTLPMDMLDADDLKNSPVEE